MMKVVVDLKESSGGNEDEVALLGGYTPITIDTTSLGYGYSLSNRTRNKGTKVASARLESKVKTRCAFRSQLVSQWPITTWIEWVANCRLFRCAMDEKTWERLLRYIQCALLRVLSSSSLSSIFCKRRVDGGAGDGFCLTRQTIPESGGNPLPANRVPALMMSPSSSAERLGQELVWNDRRYLRGLRAIRGGVRAG